MQFKNFSELVDRINNDLGNEFCRNFQNKIKELRGVKRVSSLDKLFGNIKEDWWVNNPGSGNELQYYIALDENKIIYGLSFSTYYVQFNYEKTPVDYILPFINAYLKLEEQLQDSLKDYKYIRGDKNILLNPQKDEFVLIGKSINISKDNEGVYFIEDNFYHQILDDLKKLFPIYIKIFEKKNSLQNLGIQNNLMTQKLIDLLKYKKQIILQGAPGTGKTYTAKDIAYQMIFDNPISIGKDRRSEDLKKLSESEQYKFIQFHPAYSYEDFVRGIVADTNDNNQIEYNVKNKILAEFAKEADTNYRDSKKSVEVLTEEKNINELFEEFKEKVVFEIANGDGKFRLNKLYYVSKVTDSASIYTGENWTSNKNGTSMKFNDILVLYLSNVTENKEAKTLENLSGTAKGDTTYFLLMVKQFRDFVEKKGNSVKVSEKIEQIKLKNYVLIIDEINRANLPSVLGELIYALEYRNESLDSMYKLDGDRKIILPPNLFIIGTMNTADRSVGHIDYAIRRRFAFKTMLADESVIVSDKAKTLFNAVKSIFTAHKTGEFETEDIELGHSYYIAENDENLKMKLEFEIQPLLREYVKDGILKNDAKNEIEKLNV